MEPNRITMASASAALNRLCSSATVLVACCSFVACDPRLSSSRSGGAQRPTDDRTPHREQPRSSPYTIISDESHARIKRVVDVRLPAPVDEDILREIALEIRNADSAYDRIFICYWLPDMAVGTGAWATTHFNPDLKVVIQGMTPDTQSRLVATLPDAADLIGTWYDQSAFTGGVITIERNGVQLVFTQRFTDGSVLRRAVRETAAAGLRRFDPLDPVTGGEFYVIAPDGTLEIWDSQGIISRAKPRG